MERVQAYELLHVRLGLEAPDVPPPCPRYRAESPAQRYREARFHTHKRRTQDQPNEEPNEEPNERTTQQLQTQTLIRFRSMFLQMQHLIPSHLAGGWESGEEEVRTSYESTHAF